MLLPNTNEDERARTNKEHNVNKCGNWNFYSKQCPCCNRLLECLDISRKCQKYKAAEASSNNAVAAATGHIIKMSIPSKSHARRQREG
ncbi:hypothetical protein M5D96_000335 [Drosophila gunungcola]|uniref:Uncharacterized protein n=1 Tax=Drosophila gunungcola TaxID=103775 RepID=A0A9P9YW07_9MUSC|nr:hypothetical protein M5D96_000335 [Drosophila gunungcola]